MKRLKGREANLQGKEQLQSAFIGTRHTLNLQQQPVGVYLLVIHDEEGTLLGRVKVMKQ